MNEWIHIAITSLGAIVGALSLYILHDLRDRISEIEKEVTKNSGEVAELRGYLKGKPNGFPS